MAFPHTIVPSMFGRWWDCFDYPAILWDQNFGTMLSERDLHPPTLYHGYLLRPRTQAAEHASGKSEVTNDKDKFQVVLHVSHFKPEEIKVKVIDNYISVHGKHEGKSDEYGFIQREFTRRYMLPEGTEAETVTSSISADGVLTIEAPKKPIKVLPAKERVVPIKMPPVHKLKDGGKKSNLSGA